jgi:hypothetical protein
MHAVAFAQGVLGEQTRSARRPQEGKEASAAAGFADGVIGMRPTATWTRVARRLGFDHNPLRRRSDLVEAWLLPAAVAVFLVLSPLLVGAASAWVHNENAAARQAERSWHRVAAVLLEAVPGPLMSDNGANTWITWIPARWTSDGQRHVGEVPAAAGTSAGSTVSVWLDREGSVQAPPLNAVQIRDRVVLAAVVALSALAVFLTAVTLISRCLLDRRRLAGWAAAWLSVGPQWSRRG